MGDVVRLAPEGWMGLPDGVTLSVAEIVPEKYIVLNATHQTCAECGVVIPPAAALGGPCPNSSPAPESPCATQAKCLPWNWPGR